MNIKKELKKYDITKYTILNDDKIHAHQDVDLSNQNLDKIPFDFYQVDGYFDCSNNKLTSLDGSPQTVGGCFDCYNNQITSLKGGPQAVGGDFNCGDNKLTSLDGSPQIVGGSFDCCINQLTSLEGSPQTVGGGLNCVFNQLTSLKDYHGEINLWYENPINLNELIELVKNDFHDNWKNLTQIKDTSSKKIVLKQLQSQLKKLEGYKMKKKKKYITTIVIETDYYPEELEEGYASFFINLSSNQNTKIIKKEIKEQL